MGSNPFLQGEFQFHLGEKVGEDRGVSEIPHPAGWKCGEDPKGGLKGILNKLF